LLSEIFAGLGGEAGRGLPELLREIGIEEPGIDAHVIALRPGIHICVCRFSSASRSNHACLMASSRGWLDLSRGDLASDDGGVFAYPV
jgi:hypothetical protein